MSGKRIIAALTASLALGACTYHDGIFYVATEPNVGPDGQLAEGQVCRTERPTGSNLPQRICATEEEWAAFDEEALRNSEEMMRNIGDGTATFEGGAGN